MIIKPFCENKERSNKYAQNYDRKKIMITKAGKTYNLYDSIQAAREDTEIYPTLEKYGNLETMGDKKNTQMIYADISEALDLRGLYNQDLKLKEIFENLPAKERNQFGNDFYNFKENGLQVYEKKATEERAQYQKMIEENEKLRNQPQKVEIVNKEDK